MRKVHETIVAAYSERADSRSLECARPIAGIDQFGLNADVSRNCDICAEMFRFCKWCDERYLQPRRIQFLFDVDGGRMRRNSLAVVCGIVDGLLGDLARQTGHAQKGATVTVALRRRRSAWILAVAERRVRPFDPAAGVHALSRVRRLAQLLGAVCRIYDAEEGLVTAFMFDCHPAPEAGPKRARPTYH